VSVHVLFGEYLKLLFMQFLPERSSRRARLFLAVMALCMLAACASLPQVQVAPPSEPSSGTVPAIQLESAKGVMAMKQSKAVLNQLTRGAPETNIFEHHLAAENAIATEPLTTGNKVALFADGPSTYAAMNRAIASARDHINMETYIIEDDEVGRAFVMALVARQRAGVQVNLIYDSVGSINTPKTFFEPLIEAGVNVLEFNSVNPLTAKKGWQLNQRDHRKLLIVDGRTVFLGGINISAVYSGGSSGRWKAAKKKSEKIPWRDTHMQIDGPVVASFQRMFMSTWTKQKGEPLKERIYFPNIKAEGKEVIRAISSSSDDTPASEAQTVSGSSDSASTQIYSTLLSAINNAQTSIFLTNAYFVPDQQLTDALKQAVQRGVAVKIILPGHTDSALVFHAGRSHYTNMLQGGIEIYERRDKLLHSKTVSIDGVWSSVGSSNLDWRSFLHNDEVSAIVLGTEFGQQMQAMFDKDLAASQQITLEEWRARPLTMRMKEGAARIWAYWL
jgi:cardiolipin synthase A/B